MRYSDFILQETEYTYSVNIQFDIENDKKLGRFIPNETTIALLKDFFIDTTREQPNHHARILYGSYGTGKSHFLTVLSLLLGKQHVGGVAYDTFLRRVDAYDSYLANDIMAFIQAVDKKPYLIVPITFDFEDFERSIYFSLRRVLESKGINVKFKTFYTYALSLIDQWNAIEESAKRLQDACESNRTTIEKLRNDLLLFDKKAERKFRAVFSDITYGVDFVYETSNLIDNLNEANEAIAKEYSGIVFIFDEFGRYLDDNIKKIRVNAIQDLAEYCDHGNYNTHLILVSHKKIALYTKEHGKSVANEWKKVEGRFKATSINERQDQCLSLIGSILGRHNDYWNAFKLRHRHELSALYASAMDFKGFLITATGDENPFEESFPLHPATLFALDKLSKRVAQNERTFFTYLAGKDENGLRGFLNATEMDEFHFLGLDALYDYFEPNIKSVQSDISFVWYRKFISALAKGKYSIDDNTPEIKILKLLVVIGIIDDGGALSPDKKTILSIIDESPEQLEAALEVLQKQKIIKYVGFADRYEFFDGSIYDVEELISKEMYNVSNDLVCKTLNESFVDFVLYPHTYNRNYHINRVFIPVFATAEEVSRANFVRQLPEYYDGVLAMILANIDADKMQIVNACNNIPRSIAIVSMDSEHILYEVKRYIAMLCLESQLDQLKEKDPAIENELAYFKNEQSNIVTKIVSSWRLCEDETCFVVNLGRIIEQANFSELDDHASQIMYQTFPDTPIINNELVNKNALSATLSAARKSILRAMLIGAPPEEYYGMPFLSPEYIFVRSVFVKNGLINDGEIQQEELNRLPDHRPSATALTDVLEKYIVLFKNKPTPLIKLYEEMRMPPLGLREGYLSVLLAYMLLPYKRSLIINSHGVDQELTAELIESMVKRPPDYTITITKWTQSQLSYLDALEDLFSEYIQPNAISRSRLKGIYEGMFSQYKTISKFSRTTGIYVSDTAQKYRKFMEKNHTDFSKFFFTDLYRLCKEYDTAATIVSDILHEFEDAPARLLADLCQDIIMVFGGEVSSHEKNIAKLLCNAYQEEWREKSKKSFDYYTNAWLEFASKIKGKQDNASVVSDMTKLLTGFEFLYWSDGHRAEFTEKLQGIKKKLSSFSSDAPLAEHQIKLTLTHTNNEDKEVVFDAKELSQISVTLKNKILSSISNFGQSVSYEERLQVLLAVMDELLEKE